MADGAHTQAYTFDPYQNLTGSQQHLVLGGEPTYCPVFVHAPDSKHCFVCVTPGEQVLWTEQSGPQNLDSIVWPRAVSSAEVFWTGATLPDGTPRNFQSALPRLHDIRFRMVQRGIDAIPLQPLWCALRPGACDLTDATKVPSPHDK